MYVYVLVNSTLYDALSSVFLTYTQDLEDTGFSVEIPLNFGNTAEAIRNFLQNEALTREIAGILLVGNVPFARFEINDTRYGYEKFPCDLYYMDLDGNWTDSDGNGVHDMHTNGTGDVEPEIWVGRLWASTMIGDEIDLLINYFTKNHRFRTGELTLPKRALGYVDDDFVESYADDINSSLRKIYDNETTLIIDTEITNAADYKNRLNDTLGYEWLHIVAHGNPYMHAFMNSSGQSNIYSWDVTSIDPHVLFYNLATCDAANYLYPDYIGGSYIFADTYGLLAISSTKLGAMSNYTDFYGPIGEGKCVGQAFKEWFEKNGELDRFFYYGLTMLGDPTLRTPHIRDVAVTAVIPSKTVVVQNHTLAVNVTVKNKHNFAEALHVIAYANTTFIENQTVADLPPLATTTLTLVWDTTGVTKGNYNINATAVLPDDSAPNDNTYACSIVVVLNDDVAVTAVTPIETVVVQNCTLPITVTVENKGNATEIFNVTAYANATVIVTFTNITLTSRNSTTITFTWNTTGFAKGNYVMSATAGLLGDDDLDDNTYLDGWVAVVLEDDVAVTAVTPSKTLVGQGYHVSISVTVQNWGYYIETFNVTAYYDENLIGTQTDITLTSQATTILTFNWNTTSVPKGNYTISAIAVLPGDDDPSDNTYMNSWVLVMTWGDVDGDGEVTAFDVKKVKLALAGYIVEPGADIDGDGKVTTFDLKKVKLILAGYLP